ncbi:MAG: AEC family transporter [Clostridiales bacterium]|nr:AEC family transporter [Clostridiales bacterium]
MDNALVLLNQLLVMFIYMAIGFFLYRAGLVTQEGSRSMGSLLLYIILPCVIIRSFIANIGLQSLSTVLISTVVGTLLFLISIVVCAVVFRKDSLSNCSCAFSNAGFIGIPLITAMFGKEAVFYTAGCTAILNILQWTYGQRLLSGERQKEPITKLLRNPFLISFFVGFLCFQFAIPLPGLVTQCVDAIAGLNGPIAMIILGTYLAQATLKDLFCCKEPYLVSLVRLVLIPAINLAVLFLIPGDKTMRLSLLIVASAPVGSNVAIYAQKLNKNYSLAVGIVCLSTILCLITLPLWIAAAEFLF